MDEGFWVAIITAVGSVAINVIQALRGGAVKKEQSAAEFALTEVTKRLLAQDAVRVDEVEKVAKFCGQDKHSARVMDRTMKVEISKSQRLHAYGRE